MNALSYGLGYSHSSTYLGFYSRVTVLVPLGLDRDTISRTFLFRNGWAIRPKQPQKVGGTAEKQEHLRPVISLEKGTTASKGLVKYREGNVAPYCDTPRPWILDPLKPYSVTSPSYVTDVT